MNAAEIMEKGGCQCISAGQVTNPPINVVFIEDRKISNQTIKLMLQII